jgi:hypothetical protein
MIWNSSDKHDQRHSLCVAALHYAARLHYVKALPLKSSNFLLKGNDNLLHRNGGNL